MNNGALSKFSLHSVNKEDISICWDILSKDVSILPASWPKHRKLFTNWILNTDDELYNFRNTIFNDNNHLVGIICAELVDEKSEKKFMLGRPGEVNISYVTSPEFARQGIASFALGEMTNLVCKAGYAPILRIAIWNKASAKVAQKCGYKKSNSAVVIQDYFDEEPTILDVYRFD